jgi:sulfate adenylyltransferase subunit 2
MEMDEVYAFRDRLVKEWDLPFEAPLCPPESEMDPTLPPNSRAAARKTAGLNQLIKDRNYRGLMIGIRRDEQSMRAKERVFSPRNENGEWDLKNQPPEFWDQYKTDVPDGVHMRIHPLLQWTELDIWRYIQREGIPCCELYFAKNGKRYRSLGEKNITEPVDSDAATIEDIIKELETTRVSERSGRTMDKETEDSFEKLRAGGYL